MQTYELCSFRSLEWLEVSEARLYYYGSFCLRLCVGYSHPRTATTKILYQDIFNIGVFFLVALI
jgi:hypothetical protein